MGTRFFKSYIKKIMNDGFKILAMKRYFTKTFVDRPLSIAYITVQ